MGKNIIIFLQLFVIIGLIIFWFYKPVVPIQHLTVYRDTVVELEDTDHILFEYNGSTRLAADQKEAYKQTNGQYMTVVKFSDGNYIITY